MLVYSSFFTFELESGPRTIIEATAAWMSKRVKARVDPERLAQGVGNLQFAGGVQIRSRATLDAERKPAYPYLFCAQLSHGQDGVPGRRWITEIGLSQEAPDAAVCCSFLLRTEEISARVTAPIQVTRPKLVEDLARRCNPSAATPGLRVKRLDQESALAFLVEVERDDRRHPIVLVSGDGGDYPVQPERLCGQLVGIADVVAVAPEADTFRIEAVLGKRFNAWGGAINIIFPPRRSSSGNFCPTAFYRPADLDGLQEEGVRLEAEILAAVTHRTNLPYSWRHISLEKVGQAILRHRLAESIARGAQHEEHAEYVALLEAADEELHAKEKAIADLQLELEERETETRRFQADVESLKHALSERAGSAAAGTDGDALEAVRAGVAALVEREPALVESLRLIAILFPERVVVLESAYAAAQESADFLHGRRGFDLLWRLANQYWAMLASGKGDADAKNAFGHFAYAAGEKETLSKAGRRRRTFVYRGQDVLMLKHLKIGTADNSAETLRVHFEWFADEQKIVIGYCGKHLDF